MHALADPDDHLECAQRVGDLYCPHHPESQPAAPGALRPWHRTLRPRLNAVMSCGLSLLVCLPAIELARVSLGYIPAFGLRHAAVSGRGAGDVCRLAWIPGLQ